ncbi:MAG: phosphoribosylglycinamide formyltransferase [Hydrogenimonas sp.]|nr:phosphoribosylglycinamide formyltransferase [Hydrogenimonas sp.]
MADEIKKVAVLFSGKGSNLEKLIETLHKKSFPQAATEIVPITNNPDAKGIDAAKMHGLETVVVDHREFASREEFDAKLVESIESLGADLVVMAGFMRIVTPIFTSSIKAINLHPSLLPLFKGANAIEESFKSGMKVGGVTVHWVDSTLDGGKIIAQECVKIEPSDTLQSYTQKIKSLEHTILPKTVAKLLKISFTP